MTKIESNKGDVTVSDLRAAAEWIEEYQPAFVSVDGIDVDAAPNCSADDAYAAIVAAMGSKS